MFGTFDEPRFTVRVELHGISHENHDGTHTNNEYTILHEEMKARGFSREVKGANGSWVRLPPAEYDFYGNFTPSYVLSLTKAAADTAIARITDKPGLTYSVLVTRTDVQRVWENLPSANPKAS